jgi:hypothetical protein
LFDSKLNTFTVEFPSVKTNFPGPTYSVDKEDKKARIPKSLVLLSFPFGEQFEIATLIKNNIKSFFNCPLLSIATKLHLIRESISNLKRQTDF